MTDESTHLVQSGRSVGAVAPGRVAVRVESLVALLPFLLLLRSHDVCLHPRAQFRPEHVAHECRLTERRLVENAQVDRGPLLTTVARRTNCDRVICAPNSSAPFHGETGLLQRKRSFNLASNNCKKKSQKYGEK